MDLLKPDDQPGVPNLKPISGLGKRPDTVVVEMRYIDLVDGSKLVINDCYWDDYDELSQEQDDHDREFAINNALNDLNAIYKKVALEMTPRTADASKLALRTDEVKRVITRLFNMHKSAVMRTQQEGYGHSLAMELQSQNWAIFKGQMKKILELHYKAIGWDPKVFLS